MIFEDMPFGSYDKAEHKANKAFELYENGKETDALVELDEALEINPSNSSWHFNKALVLDAKGLFDEAVIEYETALHLAPNDLEILNSLAVDYTRTGQYDLAIQTFEHIEALDNSYEPCYCNRIITYTEMGQHDLAEQMFYLAQQINTDCALCYYNIGNSLFARNTYKKAIRCWLKTAELEPSHPQINYRIAQAYWSDGDMQRSRQHFLQELRNNPGEIDVILDFGLFLLEVGNIESAKEKFNRILELKPDFAPALFYLGEIAFDNSDYERAINLFDQAIQEDNSLTGPHFRLAQYALMRGQWQEASNYLALEIESAPEDADTWVSMGSMFLTMDDLDYATHCLMKAVNADCANADAYYYLGLLSTLKGWSEDALDFFTQTLEYNDKHVCALRNSALVYLAMGRLNEAAKRIKKALRLADDDSRLKTLNRKVQMLM
ncbi:MAG: tetratricopeptide repeat protein, partial [Planctomycetota bacterium]